jgi:nucleotide-binding universal stress UspA family protein
MAVRALLYADPSPRGEWALTLASLVTPGFASDLTLLVTAEDAARDPGLLPRSRAALGEAGKVAAEAARPGPAERAIMEETASGAYGMVIVPPAGRNAIQRMIRGSRMTSVVRSVRASVLVAKRPPAAIPRLLAAVSDGPLLRPVLREAAALGRALGARVDALHVVSDVALPFAPHARPAPAPGTAEDGPAAIRAAAREAGIGSDPILREGLVVDEVLAEVDAGAYPLLAIGGPPESRSESWAREHVTERILLQCPVSILVVRGGP